MKDHKWPFVRSEDYLKCWQGDEAACTRILVARELDIFYDEVVAALEKLKIPVTPAYWPDWPPYPPSPIDPYAKVLLHKLAEVVLLGKGDPSPNPVIPQLEVAATVHEAIGLAAKAFDQRLLKLKG